MPRAQVEIVTAEAISMVVAVVISMAVAAGISMAVAIDDAVLHVLGHAEGGQVHPMDMITRKQTFDLNTNHLLFPREKGILVF